MLCRMVKLSKNIRRFSTINIPQLFDMGIKNNNVKYNLSYEELFEKEVENNEGTIFKTDYGDTFGVDTGKFTGRSPNDKWIVQNVNTDSNENLWMNPPFKNYKISPADMIKIVDLYNSYLKSNANNNNVKFCEISKKISANKNFFLDDVHFTPRGSLNVAKELYDCIKKF